MKTLIWFLTLFLASCATHSEPLKLNTQARYLNNVLEQKQALHGASFTLRLQQRVKNPQQFRLKAYLRLKTGVTLNLTSFKITGYATTGPTEDSATFTNPLSNKTRLKTNWITSNEPGEEVCYLVTGNYQDTQGHSEPSFRFSECVQMDGLFPTASPQVIIKSYQPPFADYLNLTLELDPLQGVKAIANIGFVYDETPVVQEAYLQGQRLQSTLRIYPKANPEQTLVSNIIADLPSREQRTERTPYIPYPNETICVNLQIMYEQWQAWDSYWETKRWQENLCSDDLMN